MTQALSNHPGQCQQLAVKHETKYSGLKGGLTMSMQVEVREISQGKHLDFISELPSASFLQLPQWGAVKNDWKSKSIGIFDGAELVGVALLLTRALPYVGKSFGYIPEGPLFLPRFSFDKAVLESLEVLAKQEKIFLLRIGPAIAFRDWESEVIKAALASDEASSLLNTQSTSEYENGRLVIQELKKAGWQEVVSESGFSEGQPNFVFQLNLHNQSEESLLAGFNQLWRRNIKKAEKEGVEVVRGGKDDLADFHKVYVETAARDNFKPRPLRYFERMWDELNGHDQHLNLFLATWQGQVIASTIAIHVGDHYWYSYGASSAFGREARGSNAIQWAMMKDAMASGANCYDLRGITPTLDPHDPHVGLIQFKVGTGGHARQLVGEWEKSINKFWSLAFATYLRVRR
jgi:lipid II:glycine glycyltransferase (peptidoglycan interpeptide bridge formation enzyme)